MEELQTGQRPAVSSPAPRPTIQATSNPTTEVPPPTAPGSLAPDPATAAPTAPQAAASTPTLPPPATAPPTPTPAPVPTALPPLALPTIPPVTNEQRWRSQQLSRVVFGELRPFFTPGSELWWFDPINQQHVILGRITGDFTAQAQFQLIGQGVEALELPYQVNVSYGLTALSPALLERIAAAGYESDWIETYVFLSPDVTPR